MKLHLTNDKHRYNIQRYDKHSVTINEQVYTHHVIVMPEHLSEWNVQDETCLKAADFEVLLPLKPELVLLGTGEKLYFPDPTVLIGLQQVGIGVEVMDTHAACRTYGFLMAEGRLVAAALLLE